MNNTQTTTLAMTVMAAVLTVTLTTTAAHGDHVDNNIWIETAEGNFTTITKATAEFFGDNTSNKTICEIRSELLSPTEQTLTLTLINAQISKELNTKINDVSVTKHVSQCDNNSDNSYIRIFTDVLDITLTEEYKAFHHECICGIYYVNIVKDKYTFTVTDLPDRRTLPHGYEMEVRDAIQAGLDMWGDINDIDYTYTDNRLKADIVIQQDIPAPQRDDAYIVANGDLGCAISGRQCTIQLFTDLNRNGFQTLQTFEEIRDVIAHEHGHNLGLPHSVEKESIMATGIQANTVRTYYEARGINVPGTEYQHTHEQDDTPTTETSWSADNITEHETVIEFIELVKSILMDTPEDDRYTTWLKISTSIFNEISDIIWP